VSSEQKNDPVYRGLTVQLERFRERLAGGMPRLGWKVGFSDPKAMSRMGLSGPLVAWLDGERQVAPGSEYTPSAGGRTLIEAEMAIRLGSGLAIERAAPAIEIVDLSREMAGPDAILAHSIFHEAVVIEAESAWPWQWPPSGWPAIEVNGEVRAEHDPALAVVDLEALMAHLNGMLKPHGEEFREGDWIITGSLTTPVPVSAGDDVVARFGDYGSVSIRIG
jgi:2-keto-4-pentenoate hydratase